MDEPPATPVRPEQRPSRAPSRTTAYTLADVRKHNTKEDGWIVVDGIVYTNPPPDQLVAHLQQA